MSPWTFRILDVAVSALLVGGLALLAAAWFARRPTFAARVAQGRVSEEAPSPVSGRGASVQLPSNPSGRPRSQSHAVSPWRA